MKAVNVSLILSILLFSGLQQAKAQAHKTENKQEVKVKEAESKETQPVIEHQESAPLKEQQVKTEPKEVQSATEHQEPLPVKEEEVKNETQPTTNAAVKSTATENNVTKETPAATNTPKSSLPKNFTVKRAVMPVKPIIKNIPQK